MKIEFLVLLRAISLWMMLKSGFANPCRERRSESWGKWRRFRQVQPHPLFSKGNCKKASSKLFDSLHIVCLHIKIALGRDILCFSMRSFDRTSERPLQQKLLQAIWRSFPPKRKTPSPIGALLQDLAMGLSHHRSLARGLVFGWWFLLYFFTHGQTKKRAEMAGSWKEPWSKFIHIAQKQYLCFDKLSLTSTLRSWLFTSLSLRVRPFTTQYRLPSATAE